MVTFKKDKKKEFLPVTPQTKLGECTPEAVGLLAAAMMPQHEIASYLGVSSRTLERRLQLPEYRQAYLRGRIDTKLRFRMALISAATDDKNPHALKLVTQRYLGFDGRPEFDRVEHEQEEERKYVLIDETVRQTALEILGVDPKKVIEHDANEGGEVPTDGKTSKGDGG